MLDILYLQQLPRWNHGQRYLPSSSMNQRKTRNPLYVTPNGGKEGDEGKTARLSPPRVEAILGAKSPRALNSTFSSEGGVRYGVRKAEVEELWRELFSDPTKWRDHRSDKSNPRVPDFSHTANTRKALWLDSKWIPPWVEAKLAVKGWEPNFSSVGAPGHEGKKEEVEELWRLFFLDPTEWTDHRSDKASPRFPDFKHKKHIKTALWLDSKCTPPWVEEKLVALPPGSIQVSSFSWNQQLSRYAQAGQYEKTIELFQKMQQDGETADRVTFVIVIKACSIAGFLEHGRRIHKMMQPSFEADLIIGTCLVDMYAKCGSIEEAEMVFNQIPTRNVVTFSAMIGGYVKCGKGQKALELFELMQVQGLDPDAFTFVGVLNACASVGAIERGRRVHEEIIRRGYDSDFVLGTCLVDMYAKCGSIKEAERVFNKMPARDRVTFNAMIGGYVKCGEGQKALDLFKQMQGQEVDPDHVTFVGVLSACASIKAIKVGKHVHEEIIHRGYELDIFVGTCLVDMYAKCESIGEAEMVFNQMPTRNVVTFSAMIGGYVKCGEGQKALELFEQMRVEGLDPDPVTFAGVLNACANVAAIEGGRRVHEEIIHRGYQSDVVLGTCLIDMYAKCGSIDEAETVFKQMPVRDVVTWNAMLAGYGIHGYARRVLETFTEMCKVVEVNSVTFLSLLSACSHGGLVADGLEYFTSMSTVYNITPTVEHFACVVDLLGRAGHFGVAEDLIRSMPMDPDACVWMALLGACRTHVNVELGELCAKRVLELDPDNGAAYVLLSNIYVAAGLLDSSTRLNGEKLDSGVKKILSRTWIEVDTGVHSFVVNDGSHPRIEEIRAELERLSSKMEDSGYVPETRLLWCVNEEEKEFQLCLHSEKLAIAFGLISTYPGTPLLMQKNIRVCRDCHTATKLISKIARRVITVKDGNKSHHFQHGLCSCRDYF